MMPVIGVAFEYQLLNGIMNNVQKNLQPPKPIPPLQPEKRKPLSIINFWNEKEVHEHYKRIANMYGLPDDW